MSQILGMLWIFIFAAGLLLPIPLTITLFFMAHWIEKKFPRLEKRISLSLWAGVLGLLFGLANSRVPSSSSGILFSSRDPSQGWPFYWVGGEGLGLNSLGILYPALGDILVVALIAFIVFSLVSLTISGVDAKTRKGIYLFLVISVAAVPIWANLPKILRNLEKVGTITNTSDSTSQEQLHYWLKKNAGPVMNSIELEECTGFRLMPSQAFPETMDIHFSFKAIFRRSESFKISHYVISGKILDNTGNLMGDTQNRQNNRTYQTNDGMGNSWSEFPATGETELTLIFPIKMIPTALNVDKPGPYKMIITVDGIFVSDENWNIDILSGPNQGIEYARDTLGFSDKNLKLECLTPPYTFEDLGVSTIPATDTPK